jgi:hypothetical protein
MVRFTIPTAGALLALASLAYARRDFIYVYPFVEEVCIGNPLGSPIKVKTGQCKTLQANSVKPMLGKRQKWIAATNKQEVECVLATYKTRDCTNGDEIEHAPLPRMIHQCVVSLEPYTPILSVKFMCYKRDPTKVNGVVTTWAIGNDLRMTPHVSTMFATSHWGAMATQAAVAADAADAADAAEAAEALEASAAALTDFELASDNESDDESDDEDQDQNQDQDQEQDQDQNQDQKQEQDQDQNQYEVQHQVQHQNQNQSQVHSVEVSRRRVNNLSASVWMLHPWSKTMLCYLCYSNNKQDLSNFECTSGPHHVGHCGPPPPSINGEPIPVETKAPVVTTPVDGPQEPTSVDDGPGVVESLQGGRPSIPAPYTTVPKPIVTVLPPQINMPPPSTLTSLPKQTFMPDSSQLQYSSQPKPAYTSSVQSIKPRGSPKISPSEGSLTKRRSWHKPVFFISPFVPGLLVCADAEWEKRGQLKTEMRIRKVMPCGAEVWQNENIGIPM